MGWFILDTWEQQLILSLSSQAKTSQGLQMLSSVTFVRHYDCIVLKFSIFRNVKIFTNVTSFLDRSLDAFSKCFCLLLKPTWPNKMRCLSVVNQVEMLT